MSRNGVVVGGTAVVVALMVAACSGDSNGASPAASGGTTSSGGAAGGSSSGGAAGATNSSGGSGGKSSSGGSAGVTSSGGGTSNTGGTPTADGGDSGAGDDDPIQRIQDGTIALGATVSVKNVFITALRQQPSGLFTYFFQEPEGQTTGGYVYPEFAGVGGVLAPPDSGIVASRAVGDCVSVTGTVAEFHSLTQITISTLSVASSCGTFPAAYSIPSTPVSFAAIATDDDPSTAGDQPGGSAERYEAVLVRFQNMRAKTAAAFGNFDLVQQSNAAGPVLLVNDFYYAIDPAVDQNYSSITGIFQQFNRYVLSPRSVSDVIQ